MYHISMVKLCRKPSVMASMAKGTATQALCLLCPSRRIGTLAFASFGRSSSGVQLTNRGHTSCNLTMHVPGAGQLDPLFTQRLRYRDVAGMHRPCPEQSLTQTSSSVVTRRFCCVFLFGRNQATVTSFSPRPPESGGRALRQSQERQRSASCPDIHYGVTTATTEACISRLQTPRKLASKHGSTESFLLVYRDPEPVVVQGPAAKRHYRNTPEIHR